MDCKSNVLFSFDRPFFTASFPTEQISAISVLFLPFQRGGADIGLAPVGKGKPEIAQRRLVL